MKVNALAKGIIVKQNDMVIVKKLRRRGLWLLQVLQIAIFGREEGYAITKMSDEHLNIYIKLTQSLVAGFINNNI